MPVNGKTVGTLVGLVVGLLFVLLGWKAVLILLAFVVGGFVIGLGLDLEPGALPAVKRFFQRLFGF